MVGSSPITCWVEGDTHLDWQNPPELILKSEISVSYNQESLGIWLNAPGIWSPTYFCFSPQLANKRNETKSLKKESRHFNTEMLLPAAPAVNEMGWAFNTLVSLTLRWWRWENVATQSYCSFCSLRANWSTTVESKGNKRDGSRKNPKEENKASKGNGNEPKTAHPSWPPRLFSHWR